MRITTKTGDITKENVDVIVNAANAYLMPGGGVCGAIHRAAGIEMAIELKEKFGSGVTGEAYISKAYKLPSKWVVHAVGAKWGGGNHGESELLESTYRRALEEAAKVDAKTIVFPAISTGHYGFPLEVATEIAVKTVLQFIDNNPDTFEEIIFICFSDDIENVYKQVLSSD